MQNLEQNFVEATPEDRWTTYARAERLRGQEMRRMAVALKRRLASAIAGLWGRREAGQAV